jgi:crotonobetaine/carnitine-CoA ligase
MKDCIRRRGENISSFDVENEVNAHPDIVESAAFEVKGEDGDGEVMIAVVRKVGSTLSESDIVEFLIPRLSRFMIPRFIEFVVELPKTHTNRTRKIELRERGATDTTWDRMKAGITLTR